MASAKREILLDAAIELFYREGFHATGVERLAAQAGVAKMTLYKYFDSKDDLILAALQRRDERFRAWFTAAVEARATIPGEKLLTLFDVLDEWIKSADFRGCMFINAAAEYSDTNHPVHRAAADHKNRLLAYVRDLAAAAGAVDADGLAEGLNLLQQGAITLAYVAGQRDAARHARRAAAALLAQAGIAAGDRGR